MVKRGPERCVTSSPEETGSRARTLAGSLRPGCVVALTGPLGSGKTLFVKGLAAGLGLSPGRVTSPTFTIINEYEGPTPLYHVDLYRLQTPEEVAELGLDEYIGGRGIVAIEWAEKAQNLLPGDTVRVRFERLGAGRRRISIEQ